MLATKLRWLAPNKGVIGQAPMARVSNEVALACPKQGGYRASAYGAG